MGLLLYLLLALAPTLVFWIAVRVLPAACSALAQWHRNRRPAAPGPPLESVVANLRRLRHEVRCCPPPTHVRRVALQAAYDDTLLELCAVVGVDAPLADADDTDRAFARLLTEAALEDAGILLDPPGRGSAAA